MIRLSRRQVVQGAGAVGLGLLAGCGRLSFVAPPQAAKVHRIAYLTGAPSIAISLMPAFRQGLRDLGYVEGQNLLIEERHAEGDHQLAEPAAELVRLQPEVILVSSTLGARAVLAVTTTIPVVSAGAGAPDLVASGLAASYARPGGTVTGLSTPLLEGKQLQLLREAVPTLARVAILFDMAARRDQGSAREPFEAAARTLGLQLQFVGLGGPADLEPGFETAAREHAEGLYVATGALIASNQTRIAELALQSGLPSMWGQSEAVARGGLMAYGPNRADLHRRAAYYVDRILKGTKPGDLPIEQSREFDFVINLRTAQALGLSIPQHVLAQATEVIQ
jgi:putative tryptophan/tyrosine transport system substrate-binding protein